LSELSALDVTSSEYPPNFESARTFRACAGTRCEAWGLFVRQYFLGALIVIALGISFAKHLL